MGQRYGEFISGKFSSLNYLGVFRHDIRKIINLCKNRNIKLAVASSSRKSHIEDVLTACNIRNDFELIVSGEQFKKASRILKYINIRQENLVLMQKTQSLLKTLIQGSSRLKALACT
ncbi:HAD hydrolase-like protein [Pluralibacter gergoviae]